MVNDNGLIDGVGCQSETRLSGECDIGDEGEWTGAVWGHTCTSISVFGVHGSASGTISGTSVMSEDIQALYHDGYNKLRSQTNSSLELYEVLVEEGNAMVIEFDEIDKAFCTLLGSGTTNGIIDGWTIHFGLEMIPSLEPEVVHAQKLLQHIKGKKKVGVVVQRAWELVDIVKKTLELGARGVE
ncbi:hypothetical protein Tco_1531505 [Tanacetum coccineum]